MDTSTFIETFEKKLLVTEPQRSAILAEVRQKMKNGSIIAVDPSALAYQYNRQSLGFIASPARAALFGLFIGFIFAFLTSGLYFEQWWWRIDSWTRYHYFDLWPAFTKAKFVISISAIILFYVVMLPKVARSIVRSTKPIIFSLYSIIPIYLVLAGLYGVSKITITGRDRLENVLRDIGGTQPSILVAIALYVFIPLAVMVLGMLWQQRRRSRQAPSLLQ